MSTRPETIEALRDLIPLPFTVKRMFGEYAIYLDEKVLGFVCDDTLFVKDRPEARLHLPDAPTGHPYPGSKPYIDTSEALDDPAPVTLALRALAETLPAPKPKARKSSAPKKAKTP